MSNYCWIARPTYRESGQTIQSEQLGMMTLYEENRCNLPECSLGTGRT